MSREDATKLRLTAKNVAFARLARAPGLLGLLLVIFTVLTCCKRPVASGSEDSPPSGEILAQVGSLSILESDLEHRLKEHYSGRTDDPTRRAAIDELIDRAQFSQSAIDDGLLGDPIVREEISRLLQARLREKVLDPRIAQLSEIPEERLHELYQANLSQFQAPEKRKVAVLWLNPGKDPEKARRYVEKLRSAHEFLLKSDDLISNPEKGFSALSVDHSEHQASRYRGGVIGWLEPSGGMDKWTQAVAEIAFSIEEKGGLSDVLETPEGAFLVRVIDVEPSITRSFESIRPQLEGAERIRLRQQIEIDFEAEIAERYPVEWMNHTPAPK